MAPTRTRGQRRAAISSGYGSFLGCIGGMIRELANEVKMTVRTACRVVL